MEAARADAALRKDSAQESANSLQGEEREAPTRFELVYEALQASA